MIAAQNLIDTITSLILNPLAMLIFAWGFFQFIWGLFLFMKNLNASQMKEDGQRHMIYGILGMFVMATVWGLINMVAGTLGLQQQRNGLWE